MSDLVSNHKNPNSWQKWEGYMPKYKSRELKKHVDIVKVGPNWFWRNK